MNKIEDFVISQPYIPTIEDKKAFKEASPKDEDKDDWKKKCLDDFKARFRSDVLKKQNYRCAYCRLELHTNEVTPEIEHIVPKSLKPKWMYEPFNLCLSCKLCNTKKGHDKRVLVNNDIKKLPKTSDSYLLIHPHVDKYSEHIELVNDLLYKGISEKGRYTIWLCELDRYELVSARAMELIKNQVATDVEILFRLYDKEAKELVRDVDVLCDDIKNRIRVYKEMRGIS